MNAQTAPAPTPSSIGQLITLLGDGLRLVSACEGHSRAELIDWGLPDSTAAQLHKLTEVYYGQTPFTRLREQTMAAIQTNRHSLPTLTVIEKNANRLRHHRDKWKVRLFAAGLTGTTMEIDNATRAYVREIKGPPPPLEQGCTLTRRQSSDMWTIKVTATSKEVAEINQHIKEPGDLLDLIRSKETAAATAAPKAATGTSAQADNEAATDATTPGSGVATQNVTCSNCGSVTEAKQVVSGLRTNIIIPLDELTDILNDDGDEVLLKMTNGATMTGKDLVSRTLADEGLITLVDPYEGPINLYRTSRMANEKQRLMAMAQNPTCAWEGCNHPAETAQIHHIKAWKFGGLTNPANLATACPYHNGVNDDDPSKPRRGRLERVNGKVRRIPPWAHTYR